jgi:hypothetical protein
VVRKRRGVHEDAATALTAMGWLQQKANDDEQASRASLKAEEASRPADELTRCHQLANTGRCLLEVEREIPHALTLISEAESMAARLNVDFVELEWGLAHVARWRGNLDRAQEHMSHAVGLANLRGERWREVECLVWLGMISLERQDPGSVVKYCDAIDEISARLEESQSAVANSLRALVDTSPEREQMLKASLSALR